MAKNLSRQKYYGQQTEQAIDNFPFPYNKVSKKLIYDMALIKEAAAMALCEANEMEKNIAEAIIQACNEVLTGKFDDQFLTVGLQGGAGTSINMNLNEVIASRATELIHKPVHPNDHVNMSQSSNDVNPSALKIACIRLTKQLLKSIDNLIKEFYKKAKEYKDTIKLGRTHMQDAIPITFGSEFESYLSIIKRNQQRIKDALVYMYELNLGGTAVGNKMNASEQYIKNVYTVLKKLTGFPLRPATNMMSQTSSGGDFVHLNNTITLFFLDLSKIATDLRFLSSGPNGGVGEITLSAMQAGSSIMPGKINPVIPESINQVYYYLSGKNLTIKHAAENSHLELCIMFPIIADSLISSIEMAISAIDIFASKCIKLLKVNKERCKENLEKSTAYATLFSPKLGYDAMSKIAKESVISGKTIREIVIGRKLLTNKEFDKIIKNKLQNL